METATPEEWHVKDAETLWPKQAPTAINATRAEIKEEGAERKRKFQVLSFRFQE